MTRVHSVAITAGLAACASCQAVKPVLRLDRTVQVPAGTFRIEADPVDHPIASEVEAAVTAASPRLARWGGLREPVAIRVLPNHQALEDAVDRADYTWLRAWARYDEIFLQSPRTWGLLAGSQAEIDELVLHELTHCVMYQQAGDRKSWSRREIPLWFREGMASVTAQQGARWPSLEELAQFADRHPGADPLASPEQLYKEESDVVYGTAYQAFSFLLRRFGEAAVPKILAAMRADRLFGAAFEGATGTGLRAFEADFRRYVRWRGFLR